MSDEQWAAMMRGDGTYVKLLSFRKPFRIFWLSYVLPTHQGRGAEGMLGALVKGQTVPNNRHFDTTMGNLQVGANPVDLPVESEDSDLSRLSGNMDLVKLEEHQRVGVKHSIGMLTIC